eukprot:CAMPEP_0119103646 /NCGR_PEP_ID=MMETSP1180-20130426/2047_1 /TAXON_ID=3052 ORGANISM="Chlamydomonas cf sp, Strain CCMP681" /NCGR_SAMPLE_ID=MMETSP1180 /ASSEMBLY_ACC=CAM_ASM_000741 /LENGTH=527 /DNA_ID=CAMNT_0007088205 /DNA_START=60 /DNA_END=1643 /DNA_ORIENTATION=+
MALNVEGPSHGQRPMTTVHPLPKRLSKQTVGLILIFATAIIWIISSFLSESLVSASGTDPPKVPAILLTYLATSLFCLYLPFVAIQSSVYAWWRSRQHRLVYARVPTSDGHAVTGGSASVKCTGEHVQSSGEHVQSSGALNDRLAFRAAMWSTPIWFLAQYTFNMSLAYTSVTSNTILSSTSSLFTYGLSVAMLGERFTLRKLACIMACILGTALVTFSDVLSEGGKGVPGTSPGLMPASSSALGLPGLGTLPGAHRLLLRGFQSLGGSDPTLPVPYPQEKAQTSSGHGVHGQFGIQPAQASPAPRAGKAVARWLRKLGARRIDAEEGVTGGELAQDPSKDDPGEYNKSPLWGDALALMSAALYAAYTVVMRQKLPGDEAGTHVATFLGFVGLFTSVALAPVIIVLLATNVIDVTSIPREAYLIILLEGLLDYVLSDYLWARAVMLLGPTVATLSLSVQIPLAATADVLLGEAPGWTHQGRTIAMTGAGVLLILVGFVGINLLPSDSDADKTPAQSHQEPRSSRTSS